MDVTPQSIRAVQFREKLRGYHPDDVDQFVASVAKAVEDLEQRLKQAESRANEIEARQTGASDAEESLRRTLVLAQRTADLAIQEAREEAAKVMAEAAEQRAAAEAEVAELRDRLRREAEDQGRTDRQRLVEERVALQADVQALSQYLDRERERLRIYFADQLRRVEQGEPSVAAPPAMEGPDARTAAPDDDVEAGGAAEPVTEAGAGVDGDGVDAAGAEEDPFLAELRRAVTDDQPLGPRDFDPGPPVEDGGEEDGFGLFAKEEHDAGRFGSRRRRRR